MTLIYTSLYPKKCNWIAQALAESTQESLISNLKTYPFSLLFDETSTQKFKYAALKMSRTYLIPVVNARKGLLSTRKSY